MIRYQLGGWGNRDNDIDSGVETYKFGGKENKYNIDMQEKIFALGMRHLGSSWLNPNCLATKLGW